MKSTTTATITTVTSVAPTETTNDFLTNNFTACKVAIDETKSLTLYKLKNYDVTYNIGLSSLTVFIKTSDTVMEYLDARFKAAKASNTQAALQNWQSYYKPLQEIAIKDYKKIFSSLDTVTQFDLSCGGQVILTSPNYNFLVKKNVFVRPALQMFEETDKKQFNKFVNERLQALQKSLLEDSNNKIKKAATKVLKLYGYDFSWQSVDADSIKLLKNLGCLQGAKGNRKSQSMTTLLNKVIECVYTQRMKKAYNL